MAPEAFYLLLSTFKRMAPERCGLAGSAVSTLEQVLLRHGTQAGLIIFRRADVQHRSWYCRIKVAKTDCYKTLSLKTADIATSRAISVSSLSNKIRTNPAQAKIVKNT